MDNDGLRIQLVILGFSIKEKYTDFERWGNDLIEVDINEIRFITRPYDIWLNTSCNHPATPEEVIEIIQGYLS